MGGFERIVKTASKPLASSQVDRPVSQIFGSQPCPASGCGFDEGSRWYLYIVRDGPKCVSDEGVQNEFPVLRVCSFNLFDSPHPCKPPLPPALLLGLPEPSWACELLETFLFEV